MDRRDILVLKPDAVVKRFGLSLSTCYPVLGKRLLHQSFFDARDTVDYAIAVKQRYLKLKEHECTNPPTT